MNDELFWKLGEISKGYWEYILEDTVEMNRKFRREYLDDKMMKEMMKFIGGGMDNMIDSVILSVKPKYVEKIVEGEKKWEFRKHIWVEDNANIERVYIYSSSPVKKIVGYFEPTKIYTGFPAGLWNNFADESGMSEEEYFEYFNIPVIHAYAILIDNLVVFDEPINTSMIDGFTAPQSFSYIKEGYLKEILKKGEKIKDI